MLTRRRGMLEIISVSALDLFASALGAFMLLTLVMMPFWLKRPSLDQARAGAEARLAEEARAAESTAREAFVNQHRVFFTQGRLADLGKPWSDCGEIGD